MELQGIFSNVVIHHGDYFMKENFQVLYIFYWLIYYINKSINIMFTGISFAGSIFTEITKDN